MNTKQMTVRTLRRLANMTQLELAMRAGMAPSRLSVLERGIVEPSDKDKRALAAALNADADKLFLPAGISGGDLLEAAAK